MRRVLVAALPLACLVVVGGCSGTTLREGVWELAFQGEVAQTREQLVFEKRTVRVTVEPTVDGEVAEISPLDDALRAAPSPAPEGEGGVVHDPSIHVKPMYGDIRTRRENEPPTLSIQHADANYIWQMLGVIRDDETVIGTRFVARLRHEDLALQGRWSMRWIRDR